jgi:hypothetical protein
MRSRLCRARSQRLAVPEIGAAALGTKLFRNERVRRSLVPGPRG